MTPPDEIVCDSVESFKKALRGVPWLVLLADPRPGDSVSVNGTDIIYRPKPPDRCPRCGSSDRNTYIHSSMPPHDFHAPCFHDGDYHPWHAAKDVAPRDEAREAFEKWLRESRWDVLYVGSERERLYAAFFGGRASVKP